MAARSRCASSSPANDVRLAARRACRAVRGQDARVPTRAREADLPPQDQVGAGLGVLARGSRSGEARASPPPLRNLGSQRRRSPHSCSRGRCSSHGRSSAQCSHPSKAVPPIAATACARARSEWRMSAQQVTWNSPITLPFASFHVVITSGVGRSTTSQRFRSRYSAAAGESSTLPYCPPPMISVPAPLPWR